MPAPEHQFRIMAGKAVRSIYRGETWTAYKPGQDERYKDAFVLRGHAGILQAVQNDRAALLACAKRCRARVVWKT